MRRNLFLLIFGLSGLIVLLSLGIWQIQRLNWKLAIIQQIDARVDADPVALPENPDAVRDKYLSVSVTGAMMAQEVHVLVSRKRVGAGYRIISLFVTDDGRQVMVDRGFTPTGKKLAPRTIGEAQITGNLHWPDEIDAFTPKPELTSNIWFARNVPDMARALESEPVLIIARSRTDPAVTPLPVDSSAITNDHKQYAITWFLLALVWSAMTAYFLWRTRANAESPKS